MKSALKKMATTGVLFAALIGAQPSIANAKSYEIKLVNNNNNVINVQYVDPATNKTVNKKVHVSVADVRLNDINSIAFKIAKAIGNGAIAGGSTVQVPDDIVSSVDTHGSINYQQDELVLGPLLPQDTVAVLGIQSGPNGNTVLAMDSVVTAGFAGAPNQTTFSASRGETIDEIIQALATGLTTAGFDASITAQDQILVLAGEALGGLTTPVEFLYGLNPIASDDPGVVPFISPIPASPVPEPSSSLAFTFGAVLIFGLVYRKNHYMGKPESGL